MKGGDAEGIITGTVVSAAAIAATAGRLNENTPLILVIIGSVIIYWMAHVHARALGEAVERREHPIRALRKSVAATWPILAAALLPVGVLLISETFGAPIRTAALIALIASTVLLSAYSFLAGQRGGLGSAGSLLSALVGATLGVLIIVITGTF